MQSAILKKRQISFSETWKPLARLQEPFELTIDKVYQTYLQVYIQGLLIVEDKISMAHSLESRTPMLDNEMINLSLCIPHELKLNDAKLKAIVKHNAKKLLPKSYFSQPKRGFPTPLRHWLRTFQSHLVEEKLLGKNSQLDEIFLKEPNLNNLLTTIIDHPINSYVRWMKYKAIECGNYLALNHGFESGATSIT